MPQSHNNLSRYRRSFFDELEKIAYNLAGHRELVTRSVETAPNIGSHVKELITDGSVGTDVGTSFPLMPWADLDHAFPTNSYHDVTRYIDHTFNAGIKRVANSIENGSGTEGAYGLLQLGRAHHTLMDLQAHRSKLVDMGADMPGVRKAFGKVHAMGGWESLVEHLRTKYVVDELDENAHPADATSVSRAELFGTAIMPAIKDELIRRGHNELSAEDKTRTFLSSFEPPRSSKVMAKVWNAARGAHL
jgi:hypothetical protein